MKAEYNEQKNSHTVRTTLLEISLHTLARPPQKIISLLHTFAEFTHSHTNIIELTLVSVLLFS